MDIIRLALLALSVAILSVRNATLSKIALNATIEMQAEQNASVLKDTI